MSWARSSTVEQVPADPDGEVAAAAIGVSSDSRHAGARTGAAKSLPCAADVALKVSEEDITVSRRGERCPEREPGAWLDIDDPGGSSVLDAHSDRLRPDVVATLDATVRE